MDYSFSFQLDYQVVITMKSLTKELSNNTPKHTNLLSA